MALELTPTNDLNLIVAGSVTLAGSEISAFDAASDRLFVTSFSGLQIVSIADPTTPTLVSTIDFTAPPFNFSSNDVNSVAVKNGVVAVAVGAAVKTDPGKVFLLDSAGNLVSSVDVGVLPDNLTFTPDGGKILVANEAEANFEGETPVADPDGSVSIIDISAGAASPVVTTATFTAFNGQEAALRDAGVRIFPGKTAAQDFEPEYIAVSADGQTALVTLQEANAVATLNIATGQFTSIVPLGMKDYSPLLTDLSDRDNAAGTGPAVKLETGNPAFGIYQPDAIASFVGADGQQYYVIANEGDDRNDFLDPNETTTLGNAAYDLDDTLFPNEATLKLNSELGRLVVSNVGAGSTDPNITQLRGDTDGDGDIDQIISYGGRSFSILDAAGNMVFDSADHMDRVVSLLPQFDDGRSDAKSIEPEGITVGTINGKTYAFVGLERAAGVITYEITDPTNVSFTQFATNAGDLNPEGLTFISAGDSPTGEEILAVTNEASNTLTLYNVTSDVDYTLQLLHLADGEAGLLASSTAPLLAALADAFEDQFANSITLSGGDNFIPGPFLAAGTDPSVIAALNQATGSTIAAGVNIPFAAVDTAIHNEIGVQISAIGNHEFDLGSRVFRDSFVPNAGVPGFVGAEYALLSANLNFSGDADLNARFTQTVGVNGLEEASALRARIAPSAVITEGGEKIGFVGATTQLLQIISSPSGTTTIGGVGDNMALLASILQPVIDDLIAQGVNKIVLMSHLQNLNNERALAPLLEGVDIILGAGSNTRLGDGDDVAVAFPGHAADFADTYPIVTAGADGKTTLIVNTDNEYTYLGRLVVDFDENGEVILDSITDNVAINGAYASTTENVAEAWGIEESQVESVALAAGTRGGNVKLLTDAVQDVITAQDGNVFGFSDVYLQGERVQVRSQETNLGSLSADANADALRTALGEDAQDTFIVSLKNGGGIRAQIGTVSAPDPVTGQVQFLPPEVDGEVSQLDVANSLRFNNLLMAFDTTPEGLLAILNHGVAAGTNQGRFPQIGGVSFSWDPTLPAGSRVRDVALIDEDGVLIRRLIDDGVVLASAPAALTVVTLNFLANGGDGYPIRANGENFRYLLADGTLSAPVDESLNFTDPASVPGGATVLGEQKAFENYLRENFPASDPFNIPDVVASQDVRIQNVSVRSDTILTEGVFIGDEGRDVLIGREFYGDRISGAGGRDRLEGLGGDDKLFGGADVDFLFGGEGDDRLDGGAGADRMVGGVGNDVYIVDDVLDVVIEGANGGFDTVLSSVDHTLRANVEKLTLTGMGDINGFGNAGDNVISGNGGDNILAGGRGDDRLTGNGGADSFLFDTPLNASTNSDVIVDFGADDFILLDASIFTALDVGPLTAAEFHVIGGPDAQQASDRVFYNQATGSLSYDADGIGGAAGIRFAVLTGAPTLEASQIIVTDGIGI